MKSGIDKGEWLWEWTGGSCAMYSFTSTPMPLLPYVDFEVRLTGSRFDFGSSELMLKRVNYLRDRCRLKLLEVVLRNFLDLHNRSIPYSSSLTGLRQPVFLKNLQLHSTSLLYLVQHSKLDLIHFRPPSTTSSPQT